MADTMVDGGRPETPKTEIPPGFQAKKRCFTCKPLYWYIGGGCGICLGVLMIIAAIVVKTALYSSFVNGVSAMRYIDDTTTKDGCKSFFFGDSTCGYNQYQGWSLSTREARDICMGDTEPSSEAIVSSSGWCKEGSKNCDKPAVCPDGTKYDYYMFSVANPAGILQGEQPKVVEIPPVLVKKWVARDQVDKDLWDREGVARWNETSESLLRDGYDGSTLDNTKVVLPNYVLFSSQLIPGTGQKVSQIKVLELVGSWGLVKALNEAIIANAQLIDSTMESFGLPVRAATFVRDQFFDGYPTLNISLAASGLGLMQPNELSLKYTLLTVGTLLNNEQVLAAAAQIPPVFLGALWYAQYNGCQSKAGSDGSCVIPEAERRSLDLTEAQKEGLWNLILADSTQQTSAAASLLASCQVPGVVSLTDDQCTAMKAQFPSPGSSALLRSSSGVPGYPPNAGPYFVEMTLRQAVGANVTAGGAFIEPLSEMPMGFTLAKTAEEGNLFTSQQRGSKWGDKGFQYYVGSSSMPYSCAFDLDCMNQNPNSPLSCTPDDRCTPNQARGYDLKVIPGRMFGSDKGTDETHKVGATEEFFVTDTFTTAKLRNKELDYDWDGPKVDKWQLYGVNFRTENCEGKPGNARGIDCDSPYMTLNMQYYTSPNLAAGQLTPFFASLPYYASLPDTDPSHPSPEGFHPEERVDISKCSPTYEGTCDGSFESELWIEPESGAVVLGTQRLQLSARIEGLTGAKYQDFLLPIYWVNKNQKANARQKDKVETLQGMPSTFNLLFWLLLGFGILFLLIGSAIVLRTLKRRRNVVEGASSSADLVTVAS